MDTKRILKNYAPLIEKLTPEQKALLEGIGIAIEDVDNYKSQFEYEDEDTTVLERIQNEIALEILEDFKNRLDSLKDEYTIAAVESNPYVIDLDGNVVKEDEEQAV